MKIYILFLTWCITGRLFIMGSAGRKRRYKNDHHSHNKKTPEYYDDDRCFVGEWSSWTSCTRFCGSAGERERRRLVKGACKPPNTQVEECNRFCYNGGSPRNQGCACRPTFGGRCCEVQYNNTAGEFSLMFSSAVGKPQCFNST